VDNGQDGNMLGDKERLLPTTLNSSLTTCSNLISAIHQLLTAGILELQDASTTLMSGLAEKLNASGQLLLDSCHKMPASASQLWLAEMLTAIVDACKTETTLAAKENALGMTPQIPMAHLDQRFHSTRLDSSPRNSAIQIQLS